MFVYSLNFQIIRNKLKKMETIKIQTTFTDMVYKNPNYKVFNVNSQDYKADFFILACSDNLPDQLLIPTDKIILTKHVPYFQGCRKAGE